MRKTLFTLLLALVTLGVQARYVGAALESGKSYYLLNVYQSKFLSVDGSTLKLATDKENAAPTLWAFTDNGGSYTIKSGSTDLKGIGAWTVEKSTDGYSLRSGDNYLMFDGGAYVHDEETGKDFLRVPQGGVGVKMAAITNGDRVALDCSHWLLITPEAFNEMKAKKTFTTCALNVDGMPKELKILGIVPITLNDDAKEGPGATAIGKKLNTMGYNVVGLSEDFNFHSELMAQATNFNAMTHRGKIETNATAYGRIIGQKSPVFDIDGLCLLTRKGTATAANESWTAWSTHNGYTDSGADGLIDKGYRYYTITLEDNTLIDVYILHMDADSNAEDIAARESQLKQLADAIVANGNGRPIIMMGDTNCRYTREHLKANFIEYINAKSNGRLMPKDAWVEHARAGMYPNYGGASIMVNEEGYRRGEVVDKVIYINNTASNIRIVAEQFRQDISFVGSDELPLADHWPMVVDFSYHDYDPAIDDKQPEGTFENVYLRNRATGLFLRQGGSWGTHAMQGTYGAKLTISKSDNGKYYVENPAGVMSNGCWMDGAQGADSEWTLAEFGNYYTLSANGEALTADAPLVNNYYDSNPNIRYVATADYNPNDLNQQWEILTKEQLLKEAELADAEHPVNLTFLMQHANFDRNDSQLSAWDYSSIAPDATRMWTTFQDGYNVEDDKANFVGEAYVDKCPKTHIGSCTHATTWDIFQNLTGVPNGSYKVSAQAFQRISNSTSTTAEINLYGNSSKKMVMLMYDVKQTELPGSTESGGYKYPNNMSEAGLFFSTGYYDNEVSVDVTDGNLKVGIEKISDTGKSNNAWACFDNFQLTYYGPAIAKGDITLDGKIDKDDAKALAELIVCKDDAARRELCKQKHYSLQNAKAVGGRADGTLHQSDITRLTNIEGYEN